MDIVGKITGIKYQVLLKEDLKEIKIKNFDINQMPSSCLLTSNKHTFAISKWVSPKRTRSYPFERVYNTLHISKKITVIPVVKDEGVRGDRDFIQWDTVSLMSLLDVFVIFAYYDNAEKADNKITNQEFNNKYILSKIKEIEQYHSSALHWNLNELNTNLHKIIDKVKSSYLIIEQTTKVKLHNPNGLDNFKEKIGRDVSLFMAFSRDKAQKAQSREFVTQQRKESLSTLSKTKVTITNYLGGQYFLTVDEIKITPIKVSLIEGKHSKNALLPSKGDIKDGLLKLILYSNLSEVTANGKKTKSEAVLNLTSSKLKGAITSSSTKKDIANFFTENNFSTQQIKLVETIFAEAEQNNFIIQIRFSK
ncbi:MAG: hypothetical protein R2798_14550 [Chitinophagales bacterium]|nr:hypothetical protein [Bacteroidota bacterium]MCB9043509.1 hypothetical protein [Chitinophagales bacterium]